MERLSPLEWLFSLLAITGIILILLGHRPLRRGIQSLRSRPPAATHGPDFQLVRGLPPFKILGLLLGLLSAALLGSLWMPLILDYTTWTAPRIEAVNIILQSLGFQAVGLALIAGILRESGVVWRSLLDPRPLGINLGRALAAYLLLIPPLFLISSVNEAILSGWGYPFSFQEVVEIFRRIDHPGLKGLLVFSIVGVAPVFEEILFRGVLFPWLTGRLGLTGGILISSLFFALIHFHLPSAVPLAALGIGLCLLYALTGRLILCIFVHLLFNSINLFALSLGSG